MKRAHSGSLIAALSFVTCLTPGTPARAQVNPPFKVVHAFTGATDSQGPWSEMIVGADGSLYGTSSGLFANESQISQGAIFKIAPSGAFTVLHTISGTEGWNPVSGLVADHSGNLYGTTMFAGSSSAGTLFQLTPGGTFNTLYNFDINTTGYNPRGPLTIDKSGTILGATTGGGVYGWGVVYRATTAGSVTPAISFDFHWGSDPTGSPVADAAGNLYGTITYGGLNGSGAVYVAMPGYPFPAEYGFSALGPNQVNSDGAWPTGAPVRDGFGNLFGITVVGGAYGKGVIYEIAANGVFTTVYQFTGGADGGNPDGALAIGKDGRLYGTTYSGTGHAGTVYSVRPDGTGFTVLHTFPTPDSSYRNTDGAYLGAGLTLGKDGNFYGSAVIGGANADGTVFKLTMVPVVTRFSPASGPVGTKVTVTGVNFTEATTVTVGKVSAPFTINSDGSLTLTVPKGAATNKISITNPFGKGTSATTFTVG